jgi:hypothetical protein
MKTSSAYKLKIMKGAIYGGIVPFVTLRGQTERLGVTKVTNHQHSISLHIQRGGGILIVDPDDILSLWVPQLPDAKRPEDDDALYEVRVDD